MVTITPDGEVIGPFLRTAFNYDMNAVSDATGLKCEDASLAQQQFKEDADINTIVERFGLTGELPTDLKTPLSGDFTQVVDYQSALNQVIAADEAFMKLPAHVRDRFANNPQRLFEFVEDPANRDEARKLGLLVPEVPAPSPIKVEVVAPVSGAQTSST